MKRLSQLLVAILTTPAMLASQEFRRPGPITNLAPPVRLDTTGKFLDAADRVGEDIFVAGQPTEQGLRDMRGGRDDGSQPAHAPGDGSRPLR